MMQGATISSSSSTTFSIRLGIGDNHDHRDPDHHYKYNYKGRILHSLFIPNSRSYLKTSNSFGRFYENGWHPTKGQKIRLIVDEMGTSDDNNDCNPVAPLQLETPTGQLLVQLLEKQPHLVPAAIDQQLQKLAEERDGASTLEQLQLLGTDITLNRRIAELKANERQNVLQEIMYALTVQKFVERGVDMILKVPYTMEGRRGDSLLLPEKEKVLEGIHSPEALELIKEHLFLILGGRASSEVVEKSVAVPISRSKVGRAYAASIMFGYFLRRVDGRFQLEKRMKMLSNESLETSKASSSLQQESSIETTRVSGDDDLATEFVEAVTIRDRNNNSGLFQTGVKSARLRSYVMSWDTQMLYKSASIRSKESASVIERHTEALFGKAKVRISRDGSMSMVESEVIELDLAELKHLVLEAVAFGTFMWDVECYVGSCHDFLIS